jgi:hypothetical protein
MTRFLIRRRAGTAPLDCCDRTLPLSVPMGIPRNQRAGGVSKRLRIRQRRLGSWGRSFLLMIHRSQIQILPSGHCPRYTNRPTAHPSARLNCSGPRDLGMLPVFVILPTTRLRPRMAGVRKGLQESTEVRGAAEVR